MKRVILQWGGLLVIAMLVNTATAEAYRPVSNSATQLTNDTYLLTHTFTGGFLNIDARYPIAATTEYETASEFPMVGFSVTGSSDGLSDGAEVNALVLSDATIVDNQYQTYAGTTNTFTLVAVVTLPAATSETSDVSLVLQTLPYQYTRNGEEKIGLYKLDTTLEDNEIRINASE